MKVIFLDFDGVINSDKDQSTDYFDKRLIQKINTIIVKTKAKIVVSSDWRASRSIKELQALLEMYGFIGQVIGKTSVTQISGGWMTFPDYAEIRTQEINKMVEELNPEKWIIIDDMDLPSGSDNFINTNPICGITDEEVTEAINLLNGE